MKLTHRGANGSVLCVDAGCTHLEFERELPEPITMHPNYDKASRRDMRKWIATYQRILKEFGVRDPKLEEAKIANQRKRRRRARRQR